MSEPAFPISAIEAFRDIVYYDEPHKYYIGEKQLTSVTTFIGKFKPKFDTETIATEYADKRDLDVEDVIADWDYKRDLGCMKGTLTHKYAEDYFLNKIFPYDPEPFVKAFGVDIMKPKFDKLKRMFHEFFEQAKTNLIPVRLEWVVGDLDLGVAGQIDGLFFNKKSGQFEIWDYKTNKKLESKNSYNNRFKHPIEHLEVCELNTYSLQLSLYKYIVEKNTSLKIGNCYLVWLFEGNENYKVFKTYDYEEEVEAMLKYAKQYKLI